MQEIPQKVKINAAISYFLFFINFLFLLPNKNKFINNSFVKSHTKTAIIIQFLFIFSAIFVNSINFLKVRSFLGFDFSQIILAILLSFLVILIIIGVRKSLDGKYFFLSNLKNDGKNLENGTFQISDEKEKLEITLSMIPIFGLFLAFKEKENFVIKNTIFLNLFFSLFVTFVSIFSPNLGAILIFLYAIFFGITIVNIYGSSKINFPNFTEYLGIENFNNLGGKFFNYFKNYFSGNFKSLEETSESFETLPERKFPFRKEFIYIPILGLGSFYFFNSDGKYHIKNILVLNILFILTFVTFLFSKINPDIVPFLLVFFAFGIGMSKENYFKMPIFYFLTEIIFFIFGGFRKTGKRIKKIKETEKVSNFKVER